MMVIIDDDFVYPAPPPAAQLARQYDVIMMIILLWEWNDITINENNNTFYILLNMGQGQPRLNSK